MRKTILLLAALAAAPAFAEDAFDACTLMTQADAEKALGVTAQPEPVNPKAKRPKVVASCTYFGSSNGQVTSATAQFRFARAEAEAQRAFEEERLKFQTKPMILAGASAFWSAKQGQLHALKGRTWLTVTVGTAKVADREPERARKLAELLMAKL